MLAFLLAPVLFVSSVTVSGFGTWRGTIFDTKNDISLDQYSPDPFLNLILASPAGVGFRFVNVQVPFNCTVSRAALVLYRSDSYNTLFVAAEDVNNSMPFTSVAEFKSRQWFNTTNVHLNSSGIYPLPVGAYMIPNAIQHTVSRNGWVHGNNLSLWYSGIWDYGIYLFPNFTTSLEIEYTVQGPLDLWGPFILVPVTGDWVSGLNVSSIQSSLSVGILNMTVANPFPFTTTQLNVTGVFISNGQYTFDCLSFQLSGSGTARNLTCQLPCAPGSGYRLTARFCLTLQNLHPPTTLNFTGTFCFDVTANGTINFPAPVFVPGTLLPNDGRPYVAGAGQPGANATLQVISERSVFTANMGVQHLCPAGQGWATFKFGNISTSCAVYPSSSITPPPLAVDDYSTLSCQVPWCSEASCPERIPMYFTMQHLNSTVTTADSLVYPTRPYILAVSGCEDAPPTTRNCPSSGGIWMNITMSQNSGYIAVSVKVAQADCTNVSVSSSQISCLLPPGIGTSRVFTVSSGGYTSNSVISYGAPKITRLEGGLGCVPDESFTNATLEGEIYAADASTFGAAVKLCNRNGSDLAPLTIIGDNFGGSDVAVTVQLRSTVLNVTKDEHDPHRKMYVFLPPGPGSGVRLPLTVMVELQIDRALVSYEPCPQGQDANCVACDVGRYGLETPVCEPCQKGRFQSAPGQSTCDLCPKGTYQPALGQASCILCPDQMTSAGLGSDSNKACNACPPSYYFDANSTNCARCAPNSVPFNRSCGCVRGFFDNRKVIVEGDGTSLNCQPCPAGANCQEIGTRFLTMGPVAGWWRSGLGTFVQCLDPLNCVGVEWGAFSIENSSHMCLSHRSDVLCAECEQGFQPSSLRGGACVPCDSSSLAWVWASLAIVLLMIGLLAVGFYIYRRRQISKLYAETAALASSSASSSRLASPTHSPMHSFIASPTRSPIHSSLASSPSSPMHSSMHSSPASPIHSPSRSPSSSPSTARPPQQPQAEVRQYGSVVPELVNKHSLVGRKKSKPRDTASTVVSTAKIVVGFLQIMSAMVSANVSLPSVFAQVVQVFSFLNFDFMPWASIRCVFHIDFYTRIYLSCLYPFLIVALLLLCVGLPVAFSNKRDFQDEETFRHIRSQFWTQTVTLALFCVFLLYPWVTLQLLQFGICLRIDDKYYLVADMTQLCLEGEWLSHLGYVIGLFLLLSVGIPFTLGSLLYRSRRLLHTKRVRQRLGFLYLAYSSECWWFEIVELSTRVSLISIVRCFDPSLHALLRMVCCLIYVVVVLLKMPFVYHSLDRLSLLCMAELLLVAILNHMLPVVGEWQGTFVDDLLSALMLTLFFMFVLYALFQLLRAARWLSHRPWVQRLLPKTPQQASDLQLGHMLSSLDESADQNSESDAPTDSSEQFAKK